MIGNLIVRSTEFAMKILSEYLKPGDAVLDATMGNGLDTLALAELVGIRNGVGTVYAFDIQQRALSNTAELLEKHHLDCYIVQDANRNIEKILPENGGSILLFLESHEKIAKHVRKPLNGAIFNLGYLPGEDKTVVTAPESTIAALEQIEALLAIDGMIVVVIYPGHAGGREEKEAVVDHLKKLPPSIFHAHLITAVNQSEDAPCIALITRKK